MKRSKNGFTLMEMLIVVAIIGVLAAIMIPVFSGALTKSKEAADVANIRAAYAEWQTKMLTEDEDLPSEEDFLTGVDLNYDDNFDYDTTTKAGSATITYSPDKISTTDYTWVLDPVDID